MTTATPNYVSFGGMAPPAIPVPPPVSGDVMDVGDITDPQDATVVQPVDVTVADTPQS